MEEKLPKSFQIEEINRLNGFYTFYAVPWAVITLLNLENKSLHLTGFLFLFIFVVNLLLFIYFSGQLAKQDTAGEYALSEALLIKKTLQSLNRIYLGLGIVTAGILAFFIFVVHFPVFLTPLFLVITGFLYMMQRWYYQIKGESWAGPIFFVLALILIILGNQYINWYSWGGFSGATIIWYVCLDRQLKVHTWLQEKQQPIILQSPEDKNHLME